MCTRSHSIPGLLLHLLKQPTAVATDFLFSVHWANRSALAVDTGPGNARAPHGSLSMKTIHSMSRRSLTNNVFTFFNRTFGLS